MTTPLTTAQAVRTKNLNFHYLTKTRSGGAFSLSVEEVEQTLDDVLLDGAVPRSLLAYADATPDTLAAAVPLTLSFDDAHRSVLTLAAPILVKRQLPATLFVPVRWIGTGGDWMDWDELSAWLDLGMTIGSHSMTHPRFSWALYAEDEAAHAARLYEECARSREILEKKLGIECTLFAYPYGEAPPIARAAVERAGYRAAFTVREEGAWDGDRLLVPRLDVMELRRGAPTSEPVAISVIVPVRDRPDMLREVVARLEAQSYPEDRYEIVVVDDGSAVDPALLFSGGSSKLRIVKAAEHGGPFRAGQARNVGASAARHPFLAFLDSDVVVGEDFLWALDWVHQRTPDAVVCGYLSGYNLHDRGHVHTLADLADGAPVERLGVIEERSRSATVRACLDNVEWLAEPWRLAYTGNLSLSRALFERIGGFSDRFTGWGLEDIDLGYRLHGAGGRFVFSRFALGYHLADLNEAAPRNPFRRRTPAAVDFEGYLRNVEILGALHAGQPAIEAFVRSARADIAEICGRPSSVGIEFGGDAVRRPVFHRQLHRTAVGGVTVEELLDRVAHADNVGAASVWLLGGEPAESEAFFPVLHAARRAGLDVGMLTHAHVFATPGLARRAREAGLGHATIVFAGTSDAAHDQLFGAGAAAEYAAGVAALRAADVHLAARVLVTSPDELGSISDALKGLEGRGIPVDEISVASGVELAAAVHALPGRTVHRLEP